MKMLLVGLFVLTPFAIVGCNKSVKESPKATATATPASKQPTDPATTIVNKPILGESDSTFSLSVPFEAIALTQGEEKAVLIGINKGENFREQVAIKLAELPMGVTLETADPAIKQGSTEVTLMLKAAKDAALGDFTFTVIGHTASSGADFSKELKLTVSKHEEAGEEVSKEASKDVSKEASKNASEDTSKDTSKEASKEASEDTSEKTLEETQ
jgi:hypothetical protein